ncbi:MAG: hypothetical protein KAI17_20595, partial [Thiotrichaceae bacterium]|nr:hypothetical protein [Thiotrichaceae bacterium]
MADQETNNLGINSQQYQLLIKNVIELLQKSDDTILEALTQKLRDGDLTELDAADITTLMSLLQNSELSNVNTLITRLTKLSDQFQQQAQENADDNYNANLDNEILTKIIELLQQSDDSNLQTLSQKIQDGGFSILDPTEITLLKQMLNNSDLPEANLLIEQLNEFKPQQDTSQENNTDNDNGTPDVIDTTNTDNDNSLPSPVSTFINRTELTGLSVEDNLEGTQVPTERTSLTGETYSTEFNISGDTENTNLTEEGSGIAIIENNTNAEESIPSFDFTSIYSIRALANSYLEGSDGEWLLGFEVTRTNPVTGGSINWSLLSDIGVDSQQGVLTFGNGETLKTYYITVHSDKQIESNELYTIKLSATDINAEIGVGTASSLVINDDGVINITVNQTSIEEGTDGTSTILTYTVTRSNSLTSSSIDWSLTGNINTVDLVGGQATTGTINFATGVAAQTFTV